MVALEPSEPLLLYIMATVEVVSMVLVAEHLEPKQPRALKGTPAAGSSSKDQEAFGSHLLEPTLSPEPGGALGSR
jgi:hypothetical protein